MGLMDIVKKLLTGATDEENARNKARMRELFNECVPEGDQYTLIYLPYGGFYGCSRS